MSSAPVCNIFCSLRDRVISRGPMKNEEPLPETEEPGTRLFRSNYSVIYAMTVNMSMRLEIETKALAKWSRR